MHVIVGWFCMSCGDLSLSIFCALKSGVFSRAVLIYFCIEARVAFATGAFVVECEAVFLLRRCCTKGPFFLVLLPHQGPEQLHHETAPSFFCPKDRLLERPDAIAETFHRN